MGDENTRFYPANKQALMTKAELIKELSEIPDNMPIAINVGFNADNYIDMRRIHSLQTISESQ